MSDLLSMMANAPLQITPTTGALLVLALVMALRVVRALQRAPISSREAFGKRTRTHNV